MQKYEEYLGDWEYEKVEGPIKGKCTPEGTMRYTQRGKFPRLNFRKPVLHDQGDQQLHLSTVGLGTYLGLPDDATDFDVYNAATLLVASGGVNVLDTAINYRCQKGERALGAALKTLQAKHGISRDELFICSKNGYIPDDADHGKSAAMLVDERVEDGLISKEDVAAEIHCMHPDFLAH